MNLLQLRDLLSYPQVFYREASGKTSRAMNQLFFTRLYFDMDDEGLFVVSVPTGADGGLVRPDEAAIRPTYVAPSRAAGV